MIIFVPYDCGESRPTVCVSGGGRVWIKLIRKMLSAEQTPFDGVNPTGRVHLRRMALSYFTEETRVQWEYTANWQTNKPYISSGERSRLPWCTVVSDHDDLSTGGVYERLRLESYTIQVIGSVMDD